MSFENIYLVKIKINLNMFVARNLTKKVLNVAHMKPNGFMWNTSIRSFSIKFAKSHEYANVVDGVATVGITAHAADALGDIVYVELPAVGDQVEAGEGFGSVESVKAASDVYSPVSGEVVEINSVSVVVFVFFYTLVIIILLI